jgi:hypothetical protein
LQRIKDSFAREDYQQMAGEYKKIKTGSLYTEIESFTKNKMSPEQKNEFRFVLQYGFGFITLMFFGFLSGFMVGKILLRLSFEGCCICSIVFGFCTIVLEGILMIMRLKKVEASKELKEKKDREQRLRMFKHMAEHSGDAPIEGAKSN